MFHLVGRQQLGVVIGESEGLGHVFGYCTSVARQHDGLGDTQFPQLGDGFGAVFLDAVVDDDVACIYAVDGYMDDGSHVVAVLPTGTDGIHQPGVSDANQQVADAGTNALTGNFLYVAHPTAVGGLVREGVAQGGTDGMGREVLNVGCQVQQLMLG